MSGYGVVTQRTQRRRDAEAQRRRDAETQRRRDAETQRRRENHLFNEELMA